MKRLPDQSIGAVISDPPFFVGIGRDDGGAGKDPWTTANTIEAMSDWATPVMQEWRRILRPGGAAVMMAGVHASAAWMRAADAAGLEWMSEITILWNSGKPRARNFGSLTTHVLWFISPGAKHTWNSERRAIYSNVLVAKKVPVLERVHPAQKPIELTNFLVNLLSRTDDVILDPFCGSGTTLVSAAMGGRHWIGIDEDKGHARTAVVRASQWEIAETQPLHLWVNGRLEEV